MAAFLILFYQGDMSLDPESVSEARRGWNGWAAKTGSALIDIGSPIRSTATLSRQGVWNGATTPFMGWSVIDAADRDAAIRLLQDHPLIGLGALAQINEPI